MRPAEAFAHQFKGQANFMTPIILKYGSTNLYHWELSKGYFMEKTVYGVTVLTLAGSRTEGLSSMFPSKGAALIHIGGLS